MPQTRSRQRKTLKNLKKNLNPQTMWNYHHSPSLPAMAMGDFLHDGKA
jgi:hypothetical protein